MSEELRDILVKVVHEEYVDQAEQAILALMDKRFEECLPKDEEIENLFRLTAGGTYFEGEVTMTKYGVEQGIGVVMNEIRARWAKEKT